LPHVVSALESVGASFEDGARMTRYVVDREPSKMEALVASVGAVVERLGVNPSSRWP
jgi:hypothetical protein